jgi:hypothetical protein
LTEIGSLFRDFASQFDNDLRDLCAQQEAAVAELRREVASIKETAQKALTLAEASWERISGNSRSQQNSGTKASPLGRMSDEGSTPVDATSASNAGIWRK